MKANREKSHIQSEDLFQNLADRIVPPVLEAVTSEIEDLRKQTADRLLTIEEVADWLNVSVRTVETLIAEGHLVPLRIRSVRRFTREAVEAYLRSCHKPSGRGSSVRRHVGNV